MEEMLREYLPILVLLGIAIALGIVLILAAVVLAVEQAQGEIVIGNLIEGARKNGDLAPQIEGGADAQEDSDDDDRQEQLLGAIRVSHKSYPRRCRLSANHTESRPSAGRPG